MEAAYLLLVVLQPFGVDVGHFVSFHTSMASESLVPPQAASTYGVHHRHILYIIIIIERYILLSARALPPIERKPWRELGRQRRHLIWNLASGGYSR